MNLAMEIPKSMLKEVSEYTDVDFALAHMVLEDDEYAAFYKEQRSKFRRRVILDNGMHELDLQPLSVNQLIEAAKKINPSCVVPPDKLGDAKFTYENFQTCRTHPSWNWDPMMVIQGGTRDERLKLFASTVRFTMTMGLPYREKRLAWFQEITAAVPAHVKLPPNLHLFGMNEVEELVSFCRLTQGLGWPAERITMDTAKPIKWAQKGKNMLGMKQVHGGGLLDHAAEMNLDQKYLMFQSLSYIRRFMA